jgi:hypothetical protein
MELGARYLPISVSVTVVIDYSKNRTNIAISCNYLPCVHDLITFSNNNISTATAPIDFRRKRKCILWRFAGKLSIKLCRNYPGYAQLIYSDALSVSFSVLLSTELDIMGGSLLRGFSIEWVPSKACL